MIPSETVSLVRERVDIVEVIGHYVELRRAGVNYKGLCPFHQEKTPSFNVNAARQMYHCFGCGEGGDVFTFLMNYEGRTFSDTVRELAARVGVVIEEEEETPRERRRRDREREERDRLLWVMKEAASFYSERLSSPEGAAALDYLKGRGIGATMIEEFGLGYAPSGWDSLIVVLKGLGVTPKEAEAVGLVAPRRNGQGFYDRFRDRVIFPVYDAAGQVIALGGRVLPGAPDDAPKYVNSPESPIFSKSKTLFGLHRARAAMRHKEAPILVEGNVDVISMHAQGFVSAVAPMGTALTSDQALLLRRFAGREATVVILFDGDEAGRQAALRAHPALSEAGLGAKVALLPPSEDPDSYLHRHGAESLKAVLDRAKGLVEHLIDEAARDADSDGHSKAQGIRSLAPVIVKISDPMEKDLYRRYVARAFGVAEEVVFRHLWGEPRQGAPNKGEPQAPERPPARRKAEGEVVGALLDHLELWPEAEALGALAVVKDETLSWIVEKLAAVAAGEISVDDLVDEAPSKPVAQRIRARFVSPVYEDVEAARHALRESLARLRELTEREGREQLDHQIKQADQRGDSARSAELAQQKLLLRRAVGQIPDGA